MPENDDEMVLRFAADGEGPASAIRIEGPDSSPLHSDWHLLQRVVGSTEYYRLQLIENPSNKNRELFAQWSGTLVEIGRRLRLSYQISDQEAGDQIEIYLTQAYAKPEMAVWADHAFSLQAIELVSDRQGRREASKDRCPGA